MIPELMILVDIKLKSNSFILKSLFQIVATPFFSSTVVEFEIGLLIM